MCIYIHVYIYTYIYIYNILYMYIYIYICIISGVLCVCLPSKGNPAVPPGTSSCSAHSARRRPSLRSCSRASDSGSADRGALRMGAAQVTLVGKPRKTWYFSPNGKRYPWSFGYGSKLSHQGTTGFRPCFHLPGFHLRYFHPQPHGCGSKKSGQSQGGSFFSRPCVQKFGVGKPVLVLCHTWLWLGKKKWKPFLGWMETKTKTCVACVAPGPEVSSHSHMVHRIFVKRRLPFREH